MSKGLGKLQCDILKFLETHPLCRSIPVDTLTIAGIAFRVVKPEPDINPITKTIEDPTEKQLADYHAKMQSIRRALRGLFDRGLVLKTYEDDERRHGWMATQVYLSLDDRPELKDFPVAFLGQ